MQLSTEQRQNLLALLQLELAQVGQLQQIMEQEFQALRANDPNRITEISREKLAQMRQLEQQLAKRERYLLSLGVKPGKVGVDLLIRDLPEENQLSVSWRELLEMGNRLQQQNEVNGGLVTLAQRHTKKALDILCGRINLPSTYGPEGETRSSSTPNTLAKA